MYLERKERTCLVAKNVILFLHARGGQITALHWGLLSGAGKRQEYERKERGERNRRKHARNKVMVTALAWQ